MSLQICGMQSKNPYYIEAIKTNVYSLEEINYFILHHINLVYRDFFSNSLFDYIETELGRADMAETLREMAKRIADLKHFIVYILNESYYYSSSELSVVAAYVMNIDYMSDAERLKIEADGYYKIGKLGSALRVYFNILGDMENGDKRYDQEIPSHAFRPRLIDDAQKDGDGHRNIQHERGKIRCAFFSQPTDLANKISDKDQGK